MAKKTPAKKTPAKKSTEKKAPAKKAPAKKTDAKKAPAKKAPAKKAASKRSGSKKAASKKEPARKGTPGDKPPTKTQLYKTIAEATDTPRKQVVDVLDQLEAEMAASLNKHEEFNLLSLAKMKVKKKPATKARKGVNPFTGEPTTFKAKPASKVVKILPLKNLKDYVN